MCNSPFGLLPDFFRGPIVMSLPVRVVGVLVSVKIRLRFFRVQLARPADRPIRSISRICINNVRSVSEKNALALDGNILGHAQRDRKSFRGANHGISDSRIPAGGIEQSSTLRKFSAAAALLNNVECRAVFDRTARVAPFGFAQDLNVRELAPDALEPQ